MKKSICLIRNSNKLIVVQLEYGRWTKMQKKRKVKQKMRKAKLGLVHEKRIRPHLVS